MKRGRLCQIFVLKQEGGGQQAIANAVGVSQSTISRELKRNVGERGYRYKQAQKKSQDRRQQAVEPHKMSPVNIALIEAKIKQEWSPEQVSGGLEVERGITTSLATIYLHVWANKHKGGDLYTHLRLYIADPYRFLQRVATKVK